MDTRFILYLPILFYCAFRFDRGFLYFHIVMRYFLLQAIETCKFEKQNLLMTASHCVFTVYYNILSAFQYGYTILENNVNNVMSSQ